MYWHLGVTVKQHARRLCTCSRVWRLGCRVQGTSLIIYRSICLGPYATVGLVSRVWGVECRVGVRVEVTGFGVRAYNGIRIEEVCMVDETEGGQPSVAESKSSSSLLLSSLELSDANVYEP